ncbi:hypothetical protein TNCT_264931 [Trichonephila clavata]|uniref:Uncharacterized protein n=1 Tax=Trichonephila clavata TaxID=2740835 RepID=A0A8X6K933_TRICU|nr:hypothetical protein TNCT_264931 [Trichonephila clavata]
MKMLHRENLKLSNGNVDGDKSLAEAFWAQNLLCALVAYDTFASSRLPIFRNVVLGFEYVCGRWKSFRVNCIDTIKTRI